VKHSTRHTDLVMSVANPSVLVVMLSEMGYAESNVLENTNITPAQLQDFRNLMSFNQYKRLIKNSIKITNDPHFGLKLGQRLNFTGFNMLGLGTVASETFLEALRFANRAHEVINPSVQFVISEDKNFVNVDLEQTAPWEDAQVFIIDILIAACHGLVSMFDTEVAMELVYYLNYPRPQNPDVYSGYLSGKLIFDYPYNRISIPREFCRRPLPMHNPTAVGQAENVLQKFLENINNQQQALLVKIKGLLAGHTAEIPSFESVADYIHVSPRTLNRRLKAIGTSYKEIVSDLRRRQAIEYLSGNNLSIDEIAYHLGYRDASNFSKAFRSWTGYSPSQYRDKFLSLGSAAKDKLGDGPNH
jgi:AraC-like DNA-binding protein